MRAWTNKLILILGLYLAITGVARGAPDIVKALTVQWPEARPVIVQDPVALEPELNPAPVGGRVLPERIDGLSASFTAKLIDRPAESPESSLESDWLDGVFYTDMEAKTVEEFGPPKSEPGEAPVRLVIPSIDLDAPVIPAEMAVVTIKGKEFIQWQAPDQLAAGWHIDSALLGKSGNTVINGHHNQFGEVFLRLVNLQVGDIIEIHSETRPYRYVVTNTMIFPEKHASLNERLENARWISSSGDERVTLITCWPYATNTHRLIVVASPIPTGD
jgi:LPXTG-site transpeptidase (sortase) family protein